MIWEKEEIGDENIPNGDTFPSLVLDLCEVVRREVLDRLLNDVVLDGEIVSDASHLQLLRDDVLRLLNLAGEGVD